MTDFPFELPDKDPATIERLLTFLGLMEEPGRPKPGVDVDPINDMIAVPPDQFHKGGHINLRLTGQAEKDDRTRTPSGSKIKDLMTADREVKNYSRPTRPSTVRDAPTTVTLIVDVEKPQRGWM